MACAGGVHGHRWEPVKGEPLACGDCRTEWPDIPGWPPPYVCRVEGNHQQDLIDNDVWSVARMIRELKREFGD